jgi:hypothetical protein
MHVLAATAGALLIAIVLWDAFETVILPRRVTRRFRLTRLFYAYTWPPCRGMARRLRNPRRREWLLALYGPLSLLQLMVLWAVGLLLGFALLQWAAGSAMAGAGDSPGFSADLYFSGTTLFTLGLGDVRPRSGAADALAVIEAGMGLGFLAMVVSYLPVLYQSFSRRETNITLLDARAGTPPTASELLRRHAGNLSALGPIFHEWEHWAAELLESHLSYPLLGYFRSQHDNQFWLSSLVAIMDAAALCQSGIPGAPALQAELTFAIGRHAVVDLAQVFNTAPHDDADRLDDTQLRRLLAALDDIGLSVRDDAATVARLSELRSMYEPYVVALADYFLVSLPPWVRPPNARDNWRTSRWGGGAMTV